MSEISGVMSMVFPMIFKMSLFLAWLIFIFSRKGV